MKASLSVLSSSSTSSSCYYEILGVSRSATTQDIKKAFRKLSLITHPDIAGVQHLEQFKRIAHAAQILSNPQTREIYDLTGGSSSSSSSTTSTSSSNRYTTRPSWFTDLEYRAYQRQQQQANVRRKNTAAAAARSSFTTWFFSSSSSGMVWFHTVYSPRFLLLAPLAFLITVSSIQYVVQRISPSSSKDEIISSSSFQNTGGGNDYVQAWKNPDTGYYEQPAPWDPTYQRLQPPLELVPRTQVKSRTIS